MNTFEVTAVCTHIEVVWTIREVIIEYHVGCSICTILASIMPVKLLTIITILFTPLMRVVDEMRWVKPRFMLSVLRMVIPPSSFDDV